MKKNSKEKIVVVDDNNIIIKVIIILMIIIITFFAVFAITLENNTDLIDYTPKNFSVSPDEFIEFYIVIEWDDVIHANEYLIEYENELYPDLVRVETSLTSEIALEKIRGTLAYRVKAVVEGVDTDFSEWQTYEIEPFKLSIDLMPTLTREGNTVILNIYNLSYKVHPYELVYVPSFEIQDKLPGQLQYNDSIFISQSHTFTLPEEMTGTFSVRVKALNTWMVNKIPQNAPKSLYDYYVSSDWVEISINLD